MAEQNPGSGRGNKGVSTLNLNALTADSVQLDYLAKEQQAAGELLAIQTKNAQQLSKIRLDLLNKLMQETQDRGREVESDLADFKHNKALENLAAEIKEVRQNYQKLYTEQLKIQQQNLTAIRQAETQLANFRLESLKIEGAQRLRDIAAAEKATIDALKRRGELDPAIQLDMSALEQADAEISETLVQMDKSLQEMQTARSEELAAAASRFEEIVGLAEDTAETISTGLARSAADFTAEMSAPPPAKPGTSPVVDEPGDLSPEDLSAEASETPTTPVVPDTPSTTLTEAEEARKVILDSLNEEQLQRLEAHKLRMKHLSDEHLQRMLYEKDARGKYAIGAEERIAMEEELTERKKTLEAQALLEVFAEQEEQQEAASKRLQKQLLEEKKLKIKNEMDYLSKVRTKRGKDGEQKYSDSLVKQMYSTQATVKTVDTMGNEVEVTKSKADLTQQELSEVQKQEIEAFDATNSDENLQAQAEAQAREQAAASGDLMSEDEMAAITADFFKQLQENRDQERDGMLERQGLEQSLLTDKEKAEKKMAKENSKFSKSKLGQALENTKKQAQIFTDPKAIADGLAAEGKTSKEIQAEMQAQLDATMGALGDFISNLNAAGQKSATKKAAVDTAMQGAGADKTALGSYWDKISDKIALGIGMSPLVRQDAMEDNVEALAKQGVVYNLEQRAFLMTIKDKIAATFDVADGTMRKLIRIQQADTTAARLGMESALTAFLNSMYDTSEFMKEVAINIRESLYEATALMEAEQAAEYEFQVQKWTGALYSMGFSSSAKVAETLGKITAGDISGVTEGGMGNLLIMAANEASLPIAEILAEGLTPDETNKLMKSMVEYLGRIYDETKGSNVLAQQYANVFGVTASDLRAAANLLNTGFDKLSGELVTYSDMEARLKSMSNSMWLRSSQSELMTNLKDNLNYTFATTIANNPVLSGLNNMANMLNDLVGGIEIPFINVYGFGFDLNATIADLMNVAALSGTVLGGMGKLIGSLANGGGFSGSGMLNAFGIDLNGSAAAIEHRGQGLSLTSIGGATTSASGMVGNESGDDIKNKTIQDNSEEPEKQIAEAKEEQEDKENARTMLIDGHIVDIYNLLNEVTLGSKKWHVQLEVGNAPSTWASGTWT